MTEQDDPGRLAASPVLLQYKVSKLEDEVQLLHKEIDAIRSERTLDEERRMRAGIKALGAAVIALGGVIWWLLPSNAQDAWEAIRGSTQR